MSLTNHVLNRYILPMNTYTGVEFLIAVLAALMVGYVIGYLFGRERSS